MTMTVSERPYMQGLAVQHADNLAQLEECYRVRRKQERYLRWFGWSPLAYMVRDSLANLLKATERLEKADAELIDILEDGW
jgi:hypothetical protein